MRLFSLIKRHLFILKLRRASAHQRAELMRNRFFHLGENVELYTLDFGTEPYLISIGDNVVCATGVTFVNHDVSCFRMADYLGVPRNQVDKVGPIILKDNCFVGARTMLMPGCSVGRNSVVAAGSIVTKTIPDNEVWGGTPAKFIMTTAEYAKKVLETSKSYPWLERKNEMSSKELIKARQQYFFGGGHA